MSLLTPPPYSAASSRGSAVVVALDASPEEPSDVQQDQLLQLQCLLP